MEEITRSQVISPYPASSRPESVDFEPPPPKKRKKGNRGNDDLDELLIKNMQHMQQRIDDEDAMLGRQVAATLRRLTNRQKAIAKLPSMVCYWTQNFQNNSHHNHPHCTPQ